MFPNKITVVNQKYSCKSITVITNNGKIRPWWEKNSCEFEWSPTHLGNGTISVYRISRGDSILIERMTFEVISIPTPTFYLENSHKGKLSLDSLLNSDGPIVAPGFGGCLEGVNTRNIRSYSVLAIRDNKTLFIIENPGELFTLETKALFKTLEKSDRLLFYNIESYVGRLSPVELIIEQ